MSYNRACEFWIGGKFNGANGEMMNSSPSCLISWFQFCASSQIFYSLAYWVDVSKYWRWAGNYLRCLIFCLQLSIYQHSMHRTSRLLFFLIRFSLVMKASHSGEPRLMSCRSVGRLARVCFTIRGLRPRVLGAMNSPFSANYCLPESMALRRPLLPRPRVGSGTCCSLGCGGPSMARSWSASSSLLPKLWSITAVCCG
jgi:hypothetical protein